MLEISQIVQIHLKQEAGNVRKLILTNNEKQSLVQKNINLNENNHTDNLSK